MLEIANDLCMISLIIESDLCSWPEVWAKKNLAKTGFEFSDNLAWGRGRAAAAWEAFDLRFAGIELFHGNLQHIDLPPGAWQGASDKPTRLKWRRRGHCNAHAYAHASANLTNLAYK